MADNSKYMEPLKKVAHDHFDIVQSEIISFKMAQMIIGGFKGRVNIQVVYASTLLMSISTQNG